MSSNNHHTIGTSPTLIPESSSSAYLPTPFCSFTIGQHGTQVAVFDTVSGIAPFWDALMPDEHFMRSDYMEVVEQTTLGKLHPLYVLLSRQGEIKGGMYVQSLVVRPGESFDYDNYSTRKSFLSKVWHLVRQFFVSLVTFRMLTVGNLFLTGQYGVFLDEFGKETEEKFENTHQIVNALKKELCGTKYRFSGVLYKDYFDADATSGAERFGLYPFRIDPNMILSISEDWASYEDYLAAMKSKYRVRFKNARKKFTGLEKMELGLDDVESLYPRMYRLYSNVLDGSGFVLAKGNERYFLELKKRLGDHLKVRGYFDGDELVGFYTWVLDGDKMDAHFIGFEPDMNGKHQIYLNILLDLVVDGIPAGAKKIYYFRTALEIKSSVGAEPHDMWCYFRHTNPLINRMVPVLFPSFVPQQEWKQRHPFK